MVCPEWRSWGRWMILSCITSSCIHGAPFHRSYWKVIWWAFVTLLCRSKRSRLKAVFVPCCAANVCRYQKCVCHYAGLPRAWRNGDKPSCCSFLEFLICKFVIISFRAGCMWDSRGLLVTWNNLSLHPDFRMFWFPAIGIGWLGFQRSDLQISLCRFPVCKSWSSYHTTNEIQLTSWTTSFTVICQEYF